MFFMPLFPYVYTNTFYIVFMNISGPIFISITKAALLKGVTTIGSKFSYPF